MKTAVKYIWIVAALLIFNCSKDDDGVPVEPATLSSISPTNGPKTSIVTLNGTNFGTDPRKVQVLFNGKEGSIISVNDTQIKVTVPARAYTGPITLNVNGTALSGPEFNYLITDVQVSTLAGSDFGEADGTGSNAQFSSLKNVVIDKDSNLYVTDYHRIRKITQGGVVTTIAGSILGYSDGPGATAKFNSPDGIAIDSEGNIYVADSRNHKIRKITPAGVVSTLAGSTDGFSNGIATAAKFSYPSGVTVDKDGYVYVADGSHKIRKITPSGTVSTLAGSTSGTADGNGPSAQFKSPVDVTIDLEGNLFAVEFFNTNIRKITSTGQVTTIGSGPQISGNCTGIAVDTQGNKYVASVNGRKIFKISPESTAITLAGSTVGYLDGSGDVAQFNSPYGLAVDAEMNIYVADGHKLRKITQE